MHSSTLALALLLTGSGSAEAEALFAGPPAFGINADNAVPGRDAVIPKNARLVAFTTLSFAANDISFVRIHADGSTEPLASDKVRSPFSAAAVVQLGSLSSAEGVSVQATCESCGDTFTFTVVDDDDTTAPTFEDDGRTRFNVDPLETNNGPFTHTSAYDINGCLPRVHDDNETLLELDIDDGDGVHALMPLAASTPSCATPVAFTILGGAERDVCTDIRAVDVAGNTSELQHVCVSLKNADTGGCSSTRSMSSAGVLAVMLAIGRRRRAPRISMSLGRG